MSERTNPLDVKNIDKQIRRTGFDPNFIHALRFHLTVLQDSKEEEDIESREEMMKYLFSKMFIDKMDMYPTQHFKCQVDENSDWALKPLPSEFFGEKQDASERRSWFYTCLNIDDILECRVSTSLANEHHLRVIHKYGVTRLLDDLQLMAIFRPTVVENQLLGGDLLVCELIRVAVYKIDKINDEITVYVTVDPEKVTHSRPIPKLGRITEEDLPAYVLEPPDTEKYQTYADYLNSKPQFRNPHFYDNLLTGFGIDSRRMCSYYPTLNGKECPEELTGQALLKESKLEDAKSLANSALKCLERKIYDESLRLINDALKICPEDDQLISRLYEIRSDIYFEQAKPAGSFKGLCDLEKACKLNPSYDSTKKKLSLLAFKAANANYRDKKYKEAVVGLEYVLKYDENHPSAARLINHIKTKHLDHFVNFEEKSLLDLQEKKMEIISELKKMG